MRFYHCLLVLFFLGTEACGNAHKASPETLVPVQDTVSTPTQEFPFPDIPDMIISPDDRKAYLLTHYWEQFDFADTTLVNNRNVTEQGFVNFIALLADATTPEELISKSLENWCEGFIRKEHARQILTQTADSYLFNPNSPFYNERIYGLYLEKLLGKLPQTDAMRSSYRFNLELVRRNNVGEKATDFVYYLPDGTRCTLSATTVRNNRLLLIFYDPECKSCHEVLLKMVADTSLAEAVRTSKLSVLAVYTEGNEDVWRKTLPDMPEDWILGTDHEVIKTEALYDLKAMPSLYLLDENKRVILKDAPYERIHRTLK